jgi:ATP-binding cassette subfamily B multidrug efflux pump
MLWRIVRDGLAPHRGALSLLVVLQLVSTIASLYLPNLNATIIDEGDRAKGDTGYILRTGGGMLAISSCRSSRACMPSTSPPARRCPSVGTLRARVFHRVGEFSAREVAQFGAPTLISRSTNDVQQVQMVVFMTLAMMVGAPIMMVGGVIMALRTDVGLSWLVAVSRAAAGDARRAGAASDAAAVPGHAGLDRLGEPHSARTDHRHPRGAGVRPRAARAGPFRRGQRLAHRRLARGRPAHGTGLPGLVMLVFNASTVAVLWFGAHRVDDGDMLVGALTAFMSYLMQILMSVMMATMMSMMIPRASVSAERIMKVLDTETSVVIARRPTRSPRPGLARVGGASRGRVPLPKARRPRSCKTSRSRHCPGETTAIIGSTGAGKTTLMTSIPRLFDATGGRRARRRRRRARGRPRRAVGSIGLVPQKPYLFSGTVASNLRYGKPDATDDELWEALRIAQAEDFVREMDGGLEASHRPGRHQRLWGSAPAAGHRPGASSASPRSTSSTTPSRRSMSRRTPGCGPRWRP